MKNSANICALAAAAALLSGCGGTSGGAVPSTTQASLSNDKLQLAVGTAYNAADGTTGINVVATFRQSDGDSAVLADQPSITGPAGFSVPTGFPGAYGLNDDIGSATISSSPQVPLNETPSSTTLGTFTGVFSYGLAPLNSDTSTSSVGAFYPGSPNYSNSGAGGFEGSTYDPNYTLPWWNLPFVNASSEMLSSDQSIFLIGPPAVPFFNNGLFPTHFAGYSPGFTPFEITPVTGTYTMTVKVPTSNSSSPTFTATATLASTAALTAPTISGVTENGGGLTGTVTVGAGVTETLVFISDQTSGNFYTVEVTGTGPQTWTLPAMLGACAGNGCQNNASTQTPSLATGDSYIVQAVSFDYPAFEAGPPGNTSQTPTIVGSNGQADLAIGAIYPATPPGTYSRHRGAIYGKHM